jgi:hypothetical protein
MSIVTPLVLIAAFYVVTRWLLKPAPSGHKF